MSPEAELHLSKARRTLSKARAFTFERTGRTPKTHHGVRARFGALARHEARIDITLRRFLTDGYDLKTVADYEVGPAAVVSTDDANEAIETARRFVECAHGLLSEA
jgi:uncharacterized protein (UPF0332 family)